MKKCNNDYCLIYYVFGIGYRGRKKIIVRITLRNIKWISGLFQLPCIYFNMALDVEYITICGIQN
jgi:hypothetical protein